MSALSGDVTKRSVAMHAEDFFTKPLDLARLKRRITDLLYPEPSSVSGAEPARGSFRTPDSNSPEWLGSDPIFGCRARR